MTSLPAGDPAHDPIGAPAAPLVSRTVPLDPELGAALLSLIPAVDARDVCSWVRRGEGIVGWGRAAPEGNRAGGQGQGAGETTMPASPGLGAEESIVPASPGLGAEESIVPASPGLGAEEQAHSSAKPTSSSPRRMGPR